jgi:hypothetical protein
LRNATTTACGTRDSDGNYVLHDVGTGSPGGPKPRQKLDTPSLLGLGRSEPYLYDGRAKTLEEIFTRFNAEDKHGRTSHLGDEDVRALAEFLRSLTPPRRAGIRGVAE